MSNISLSVSYDVSRSSKSLSSYRIALAPTDEPVTGRLRGSNVVHNNADHTNGVFDGMRSALEAAAVAVNAPFSVYVDVYADAPELVVRAVDAKGDHRYRRVATVRQGRVSLHDVASEA